MSAQPARAAEDGPASVTRIEDGRLAISVTTGGLEYTVVCGEFNAWRIFAMLALLLGISLPGKLMKGIKL